MKNKITLLTLCALLFALADSKKHSGSSLLNPKIQNLC